MKSDNMNIENKSYSFARRIIKVYKYLVQNKEYILSKQLLRSGTSIGANVIEAQYAISKKEFRAKMSIALKEAVESRYWINLLKDEEYLSIKQAESLIDDLNEIISILVKVVKNAT
jgi:four helix bundle protein